jgi:hypothetical protein
MSLSDIEIAQQAKLRKAIDIAAALGIQRTAISALQSQGLLAFTETANRPTAS